MYFLFLPKLIKRSVFPEDTRYTRRQKTQRQSRNHFFPVVSVVVLAPPQDKCNLLTKVETFTTCVLPPSDRSEGVCSRSHFPLISSAIVLSNWPHVQS